MGALRVKGNQTLASLKKSLRALPVTVAQSVATRAAPALTGLTQAAFSSGRNVYGDPRPAGVDGNALSLRETGLTEKTLRFVSTGTLVRCVLAKPYMRYLIGKYGVLPNGALPLGWSRTLGEITARTEAPL